MNQPILQKTAVDIVKKALRLLGVIDAELSLNAVDREQGIDTLNDMVKNWQQQGFHLDYCRRRSAPSARQRKVQAWR